MKEKIKSENLLDSVLEQNIAIVKCDNGEKIDTVTVDEICGGFELYIDVRVSDQKICLYDFQDENYECVLGEEMEEVLLTLNSFREYFNDLDDEAEAWESDFLAYY